MYTQYWDSFFLPDRLYLYGLAVSIHLARKLGCHSNPIVLQPIPGCADVHWIKVCISHTASLLQGTACFNSASS